VAVDCIKEPPKIYYYIRKTHWVSNYDNYNVGTIENKGIEIAAIPIQYEMI
jgi:hypothetical protein